MKRQLSIRCIAMAVFGLIICSPLTCLGAWRDLTATELKAILDSKQDVVLVNPLSDIEFNEGHIPGSVNIPLHTIMGSDKLPENENTLVVTYCLSKK